MTSIIYNITFFLISLLLLIQEGKSIQDENDKIDLTEICPKMLHRVFYQSAPTGDTKSGNFSQFKDITDIKTCVKNCCLQKSNCNIAFIFEDICYHVKCLNNELCLPKKRKVKGQLQMVLVNPVLDFNSNSETSTLTWIDVVKSSNIEELIPTTDSDPEKLNFWKQQHKFRFNNEPSNYDDDQQLPIVNEKRLNSLLNQKLNDNNNGYDRFSSGQQFLSDDNIASTLNDASSYLGPTNLITCDLSILEQTCRFNEECIPIIPESREGVCRCLDGFKRNKLGKCIKISDLDFAADTIVQKLFNDNNMERQSLAADLSADTTTKPPLKKIEVTVTSRTVQLPEKEVTLEAFTAPDEQTSGDTYRYSWTLVTQPSGPVNGTITDQAKDKVKLSNLSEGLYTFKITVNGSGSYGETMVNVTVLPEKRINKLPEAIITPKEQTIKPPNSKAILDGSTSIDDDKIISWHWELIQGPIGYQPVLPDTSTLQLTDLEIPGNYTFKLTVTDSDNKQNSTTSNIIVQKITDYPPEANAGPDVILYLPHNNVTLNGTMSTDDREIMAWEWTNDSNKGGKAVDMQHTRTPYLQLSNLEEGFYTFVLKVTDISNQSSSAKVNVFVKPPSNLPPVANAGPNVGNVDYLWEYFSKFGEISDIKMKKRYTNFRNEVFFRAYINYANPDSAFRAIQYEKTQDNEMVVTCADSWKQPDQNVYHQEIINISNNEEFRLFTLNDYCLLHIFGFLTLTDQLNLSLLSSRLENILLTYYRTKKSIDFEDHLIEGLTLMKLRNFLIDNGKYIEKYDRLSTFYETKNLRLFKFILKFCPNLNSLKFSWTSFKNEKFSERIAKYDNMQILEIMNCRLNDNDIENLSNLNKIKILNLAGNNEFTGIHMDKFINLESLNLNSCEDLTEQNFVSMIKNFNNLKYLNIQGCRNLRNLTFQNIAKYCNKLENLNISIYREEMRLIGIEIGEIKTLKHLTVLNSNPRGCTGYFSECDKLSEFLKAICQSELKNHLLTLKMPLCKLKNNDYLHIGQFTKLKTLLFGIYSQEIPPNFVIILEFLKDLELLCIRLESFYSLSLNFVMEVINILKERREQRKLLTMKIDISKIKFDKLEQTINLPQTWIILNGSQSSDVIHIKGYNWVQISGPNKAIIANANASIANATALTVGKYVFELTVTDENKNTGKDQTITTVVQEKNYPPKADAGGDQTVKLPISAVYLNGSKSSDDLRIVKFLWTRDDSSLAYGNIVGQTDHEPILILTDLVPGHYSFTLTVYDNQGLSNSQSVNLIINQDPIIMNLVELTLSLGITSLTKNEYDTIVQKIALIIGDVKVHVRDLKIDSKSGEAILVFYVEKINPNGKTHTVPGVDVEKILKDKFFRDESLLGTPFTDARTTVCQNKCSGHGNCDTITRACLCEAFWMPSIFYYWGVDDANCDWSVLYVVVGVFVGFLLLSGIFWGISCVFRRRRAKKPRTRPKKLQKYALLGTQEDELPSFTRGTSLTDSDTDSDVLFESRSKQNGILRLNGTNKNGPKYSKTRLGRKIRT